MKNVFDEKQDDFTKSIDPNKGQSFYVEKYNKIWLGKRKREKSDSESRGRKRVKFSNFELCLESHPHLESHVIQRS